MLEVIDFGVVLICTQITDHSCIMIAWECPVIQTAALQNNLTIHSRDQKVLDMKN